MTYHVCDKIVCEISLLLQFDFKLFDDIFAPTFI